MAESKTRRPPRGRAKRTAATHVTAGFTIGILAVVTGLGPGGTVGGESAPVGEAARVAEVATAVRLANDPELHVVEPSPIASPVVKFGGDDPDTLFRPRWATRVTVPSVGIDASVSSVGFVFRDGRLDYDVPRREAGHYVGTAEPGAVGNAVIAGHVANRGAAGVFARLAEIRAGDLVRVYQGDRSFDYAVTEIRVVPADATDVMRSTTDRTLTLITCLPDDNFRERLVVVGKLA